MRLRAFGKLLWLMLMSAIISAGLVWGAVGLRNTTLRPIHGMTANTAIIVFQPFDCPTVVSHVPAVLAAHPTIVSSMGVMLNAPKSDDAFRALVESAALNMPVIRGGRSWEANLLRLGWSQTPVAVITDSIGRIAAVRAISP